MLHLDYNSFNLNKSFIEIRYKDSFKLPIDDTRYKILDKLTKKYTNYQAENRESLSFFENNKQLHIQMNRIIIDWEKPSLDEFIKSANSDINFILKTIEVSDILRIGFRTLHSFESNNQESIDQYIFKEYMTSGIKSTKFADHYFNPRVQFSGKKSNNLFNMAFYYQKEQTIEGTLDFIKPILNQNTRDLLVVDLDGYRENLKTAKIQPFLNEIKDLNRQLPDYIKSIRNDKFELSKQH